MILRDRWGAHGEARVPFGTAIAAAVLRSLRQRTCGFVHVYHTGWCFGIAFAHQKVTLGRDLEAGEGPVPVPADCRKALVLDPDPAQAGDGLPPAGVLFCPRRRVPLRGGHPYVRSIGGA